MSDVIVPVGGAGVRPHAQVKMIDQGDGTHAVAVAVVSGGGGGGGGTGDASAANQVITNTRIGDVTEAAPASDTASSGLNGRLQRIAQNLTSQTPLIGANNESAPASDTASSGLNGRLQRIAQRLTSLIALLPASLGPKTSGGALAVVPATDAIHITGGITANVTGAFNRPANTTAYDVGDLVANNTTAGAVTPITMSIARVAAGSGIVRRVRLRKSGTSLVNASFRVHLFETTPTVANGDNGAFLPNNVAGYLGSADVTMTQAFSDGTWGSSDASFMDLNFKLGSGSLVHALIEARAAYTPTSAETFTVALEVLQD